MLNYLSARFSPVNLWIFALWFALLLLPLLRVIPNPASITGNPWKVELFASFFLCLAVFWALLKKIRLEVNLPVLVPFLLFIAWSGISFLWAESGQAVAHHTLIWVSYLLFYCVFLYLLKSQSNRTVLFAALAVAFLIIAFSCFFDSLTIIDFGADEGHFRTRYARYAEPLAMLSPLFWALSLQVKNRKNQFIFLAIGAAFWLGVMFSLSKGAFIAGICCFTVFFVASLIFPKKIYDRRKIAVLVVVWLLITCASQISFKPNSNMPTTADYIGGRNAEQHRNTTSMRVFTWKIARQMFGDHPLNGVGADNFGLEFKNSRINYGARNPDDELLVVAEDYMVERAHNEFLQIFAELGIVGAMIFLSLVGGFLFLLAKAFVANSYRFSPLLWACVAGFCGFFVSSMFSSFSFRVVQNGIAFFFVLALATYEMQKIFRKKKKPQPTFSFQPNPVLAFSFSLAALFFVISLSANLSNHYVLSAENAEDFAAAEDFYRQAIRLNPQNASAYFSYGQQLYFKKQPEKAVPMLEKAIENGLDASIAYSYLASAQAAAQNSQATEETIAQALRIYPRSIFLRVRYASLLEKKGETEKSDEQMEIARRINDKQANSWQALITTGATATALKARSDEKILPPHELLPTACLYAVLDEQAVENRFPRDGFLATNKENFAAENFKLKGVSKK
ncbi:MAG TPA: O-antigen ligase family protein [Pyrinomonadaceae bacterium]|jgi:O-antigen ligase